MQIEGHPERGEGPKVLDVLALSLPKGHDCLVAGYPECTQRRAATKTGIVSTWRIEGLCDCPPGWAGGPLEYYDVG